MLNRKNLRNVIAEPSVIHVLELGEIIATECRKFIIGVLVDTRRPFCVQRHIAILKPPRDVDIKFLRLLLASTLVYLQATKSATGAAQPTVALKPLRNFLVPLPPLAEQRRIVSKVDELMKICDLLEAELSTAQNEKRRLLESVLHDALNESHAHICERTAVKA